MHQETGRGEVTFTEIDKQPARSHVGLVTEMETQTLGRGRAPESLRLDDDSLGAELTSCLQHVVCSMW